VPEPNALLRAARERTRSRRTPGARMSRDELADLVVQWLAVRDDKHRHVAFDGGHLGKIERGAVGRPRDHYVAALCAVLYATEAELGLAPTRPSPSRAVVRASDEPVSGGEVILAADESIRFLAWAEAANVGELTVEQMHSDVRRIAHNYLKAPTAPLFARARALRDRTFELLSGRQDPRHTREMYAAAGWSLTVLAWMSVDLGHADAAEQHARTAWLCADRSDHNGLRAWVRATQHTAAFWQDEYEAAAKYAADGLRYGNTGTARLYLSTALAMDLARAGDAENAMAALGRAQDIAATVQRADDELSGPFTPTLDRAGSLWSDAQLAIGEAGEALTFADRAVARFEATPAEARNLGSERMARLQQVKAHLALGELGAAEDALTPVLATAPQHRVGPLLKRVGEVGAFVSEPGRAPDPVGRRIRAAITDFHRDAAIKELT
jgi:hypothetical protein